MLSIITPGPNHLPGIYRSRPRRRKAMNDQDRTAETLVPPTDRDAPTNPEASARPAVPPPAIVPESDPPGRGASAEVKQLSTDQLIALYTEFKETQRDLLSETGGFAQLLERRDERLVASFAKTVEHLVEPRFSGIELKLSKQGELIHKLEKECAELRAEQSKAAAKLEGLERELAYLKEQRGAGEAAAAAG